MIDERMLATGDDQGVIKVSDDDDLKAKVFIYFLHHFDKVDLG